MDKIVGSRSLEVGDGERERERAISILLNIQYIIKYFELILQVGL